MNWNKWIRQIHRWLSMIQLLAIAINFVAVIEKKYTNTLGLMAVAPFALLMLTGLYLFLLPYAAKLRSWQRGVRRTA
jgi:hypothetical protein